jgi:hypothetical protein
MQVLAFGHQKRVGKDESSKIAMSYLRLSGKYQNVQKKGFADKVKQQCYELYQWAGLQPGPYYDDPANAHLREQVLPLIGQTPRQLWIGHGMAVRQYYPNVWVDYLLKSTRAQFLIVSDMRFPNEAEAIHSLGGKVIKIVRPSIIHTSDAADDPLLDYTGWDDILVNDSDIAGLTIKVHRILEKHFGTQNLGGSQTHSTVLG